ncbi:GDP-mannose-dependent alpha-(1-6)-phosphatidylinositol monomannoside mannosyltransferase [Symmachiella macrocystis]|uniref:GDP-mannose-dependent alpha-(1-6)-phosphatidylinositol monomannoside mannosyltransferase n=1 Tax=Symmachiella macrocystis TaxID=2527985 RepID=A0A5C6BRT9_9PLAN|nr:glycosyltransferase family 4 protein [Symmachiella macrocystis]TWU14665.1 GDP-mannose-dependent alpha-(1-6)-phosphatidylinositol monomannoside mannosyltransferase [Symmachiella macrocystis]
MHIAIITAGGAGMFCGSCMHDNTWARALQNAGHEVSLIPTYTPIRVDETNVSTDRIFFGGLNVYLDYRFPIWQKIPRGWTRWLDSPGLLNLVTRFAISNDAQELGALTVAMLQGSDGPNFRETHELADFLGQDLQPDVICFSNILLSGAMPRLRESFSGPVFCLLQGDDIFLADLPEPFAGRALELINSHGQLFDGFLTHSDYYSDFMSGFLGLPREKFIHLPLGIDLMGHDGQPLQRDEPPTIGYFARICPEKGFDQLLTAFGLLQERHPHVRFRAGGYLGKRDAAFFKKLQPAIDALGPAFEFVGSPETHAEKVAFLKSLDILSVPTTYHEPKGIYVLEALANGVPVVQPRHGAFPELINASGGGLLVDPDDPQALMQGWESLILDPTHRLKLAQAGHTHVHERYGTDALVDDSVRIFQTATADMASAGASGVSTAPGIAEER